MNFATFYPDVLPILQDHCQSCHRPGEIANLPLVTYEQAQPVARKIGAAVANEDDAAMVCRSPLRPIRQTILADRISKFKRL